MPETEIMIGIAALFGLLIGSFLNVCIFRLPRDLSVVAPRSFCVGCEKTIAWYDNVPVLSYVLLAGKCRNCKQVISWRYPLVEVITAVVFGLAVWKMGATVDAVKLCLYGALLVGLVFMDLEERILADEFTVGGMTAGFVISLFVPMPHFIGHFFMPEEWRESWLSLSESLIGGLAPSFVLWGIGELYYRVRGREGLGFGDVKMIAMIGAFYGLQGALLTLIVGSVMGSVLGIAFILVAKKDAQTYELPFGTFLGIAGMAYPFLNAEATGLIVVPW